MKWWWDKRRRHDGTSELYEPAEPVEPVEPAKSPPAGVVLTDLTNLGNDSTIEPGEPGWAGGAGGSGPVTSASIHVQVLGGGGTWTTASNTSFAGGVARGGGGAVGRGVAGGGGGGSMGGFSSYSSAQPTAIPGRGVVSGANFHCVHKHPGSVGTLHAEFLLGNVVSMSWHAPSINTTTATFELLSRVDLRTQVLTHVAHLLGPMFDQHHYGNCLVLPILEWLNKMPGWWTGAVDLTPFAEPEVKPEPPRPTEIRQMPGTQIIKRKRA